MSRYPTYGFYMIYWFFCQYIGILFLDEVTMEKINKNISINLKTIRKQRRMTLEDVSGVSGVSKSMLGEIERGSTNPTILILWKIAEGLKVPLTILLEEEKKDYFVVRNNEKKRINNDSEFSIFTLFPYYDQHNLEVHKIEIQPSSTLSNPGHLNGVDEYIFLINGEVKIKVRNMEETLYRGDAIRFNAVSHHEIINKKKDIALLLNVMVYMK